MVWALWGYVPPPPGNRGAKLHRCPGAPQGCDLALLLAHFHWHRFDAQGTDFFDMCSTVVFACHSKLYEFYKQYHMEIIWRDRYQWLNQNWVRTEPYVLRYLLGFIDLFRKWVQWELTCPLPHASWNAEISPVSFHQTSLHDKLFSCTITKSVARCFVGSGLKPPWIKPAEN